jgi:hypothetical protein
VSIKLARYVLMLNDMRDANIENLIAVRVGTEEELHAFYGGERVEEYSDGWWGKGFRAGGPLEWFNTIYDITEKDAYWGGLWTIPDGVSDEDALVLRVLKA